MPPLNEYSKYLEKIWQTANVTNRGPYVLELEEKLKDYLGVNHLLFVSNGTIALQIAIKALNLKGSIITTPFSYVATTTSILWEDCKPVFVDIEPRTFCIDPQKIEAAITPETTAILATHVYGYPCDVEAIKEIADKYNLKVIYDGAHAFGVNLKGRSILNYGDISTLSFHATKLFHTIEGGAIICNDDSISQKIKLYHQFGHIGDDYFSMGINGKNSELHAAMGLCNLPLIKEFILERKHISELYDSELIPLGLSRPEQPANVAYNYSYYPVICKSEEQLLKIRKLLLDAQINTRRYFYPSLNNLSYNKGEACPVSEDISKRVLCLPLFQGLQEEDIKRICEIIRQGV